MAAKLRILVCLCALIDLGGCQIFRLKPTANPFYGVILDRYPENAVALYLQGHIFFGQGQFEAAQEAFGRYSKLVPQDSRGWVSMAQCEMELRRFAAAESAFRQAAKLHNDDATASGLVSAILMQGRMDDAGKALEDATKQFGDSAALFRVQGDIAFAAGRGNEALKSYEDSLSRSPAQPDLQERVRDLRDFLTNSPGGSN